MNNVAYRLSSRSILIGYFAETDRQAEQVPSPFAGKCDVYDLEAMGVVAIYAPVRIARQSTSSSRDFDLLLVVAG